MFPFKSSISYNIVSLNFCKLTWGVEEKTRVTRGKMWPYGRFIAYMTSIWGNVNYLRRLSNKACAFEIRHEEQSKVKKPDCSLRQKKKKQSTARS